jgi:hypothetical protein
MKTRFIISVCIIVLIAWTGNHPIKAQAPDTLWARTFGGSNIDIGHSVQQTSDMGYVITGYTRSFGSTSGRNVWLVKTDADGNLEWQNAFGGNNDDEGYSIKQTSEGGYIISGHTKSFGAGGKDVLLIKADADGNQEWLKTYGGNFDDEGYSVLQTPDGGYLIAGVTSSFSSGGRDVWLVKTDSGGNQEWTKSLGGMSSDGAWSVVQTTDGGFALAGWTFSYGPGPLGNAWLVKTDATGNQLWQKAFGGSDVDRAHDLKQLDDGGYILTGYTSSSGAGLYDMLLIRTDSLGNEIWTKTFGGSGRDYGQSVLQIADDGGFLAAGYTLSYGMGSDDMWLVRTDVNGELLWHKTLGGSSSDVAFSVQQSFDGGFIVTGHTLSFGAGVHDVWLVKIAAEELTAISGSDAMAGGFVNLNNFPNPFNETTVIELSIPQKEFVSLEVYDLNGRLIKTLLKGMVEKGTYQLNFEAGSLEGGIYFYKLKSKRFSEARKMILLK